MPAIIPQLFNSYVEIHTAQLGIFVGLLYREHPLAAYRLLFCAVAFAFGNSTHIGYSAIDRKPWYFLSGTYVSTIGNFLVLQHRHVLLDRLPPLPTRSVDDDERPL